MARKFTGNTVARVLFNSLFFVIGIVGYSVGLSCPKDSILYRILTDYGLIIAGAALVFFIFSWITERQQIEATEDIVGRFLETAIREVFQRVGLRTTTRMWSDYRWHCVISKRSGDNDPYTKYVLQHLNIQFCHPELPAKVRLVIGWSNENDAAKPYNADRECLAAWEMSWLTEQPINLADERSHQVDFVKMNGEDLKLEEVRRDAAMKGGKAFSYEFAVPPRLIGTQALVALSFSVRKISSAAGPINIITRLREDCYDAQFFLQVDENIGCKELFVYTTEVSQLVERYGNESAGIFSIDGQPKYGWARFQQIIQKGSNIRFEVRHDRKS